MAKLVFIASVFTVWIAVAPHATAQTVSSLMYPADMPGTMHDITQRITADDLGYDAILSCRVPAMTLGVITVAKKSRGPAANVFEAAKRFGTDGQGHIFTEGVIARGSAGATPGILLVPPSMEDRVIHYAYEAKDTNQAEFQAYCDNVDLLEQVGFAALRTFITYELSGTELEASNNASRGINLLLSVLSNGDNAMAVGLDAAREELVIKLNKEYPKNPVLVNFLSDLFSDVAGGVWKHAFYEMSPHLVRD